MRIIGLCASAAGILLALATVASADGPAAGNRSVAEIQAAHDRALVADLVAYIGQNPRAYDLDQAYQTLLETVIQHDWFTDHEAIAARYLTDRPDGPVRSLAQIVTTMARAQAGNYALALARFKELMAGLGKTEQEEFAVNFADSLATSATGAGEYAIARQVYQALQARYPDSPTLRQKITGELARLDKVGKPAPAVVAKDLSGQEFRLESLKGKYVLINFWATWCAPCVAELPRLRAAHETYKDRGLEVVGVSLDESKAAVTDFVKARAIPWRELHNASCETDVVEAFGVGTIPATFLVDPDGKIVRLELRGAALDQALARILGVAR